MTRHDPKIDRMRRVPSLASCSTKELKEIAALVDEADVPAGRMLMREGAHGREAFIIAEGTADVSIHGRHVGRVGPGDLVGEMALLDRAPRCATVIAGTSMRLLASDTQTFSRLAERPAIAGAILSGSARRVRGV